MDETGTIELQGVTYLAQEVQDVCEGKTLVGCYLIIVEVKQPPKLQIGRILNLIDLEVNKVKRFADADVRNRVIKFFLPLVLLCQHDGHDLANFQLPGSDSGDTFDISVSEIGVVLMIDGT